MILISEAPGAQEQKSTYILTGIHILKASRSLNESVGCVLRRLQRLSPFGLVAPDLVPDKFDDFNATKEDMIIISRNLNGQYPWIDDIVASDHLDEAALKLKRSMTEIISLFNRFEPLGIYVRY
jgi:hypothetical protein